MYLCGAGDRGKREKSSTAVGAHDLLAQQKLSAFLLPVAVNYLAGDEP